MEQKVIQEVFDEPFAVPDFASSWNMIREIYSECGFNLPLIKNGQRMEDDEIINEFSWVYSQYSKFVGIKKNELKNCINHLDDALEFLNEYIGKKDAIPDSRKMLVYQRMKAKWLSMTYNHLAWLQEAIEEDRKDEDGE